MERGMESDDESFLGDALKLKMKKKRASGRKRELSNIEIVKSGTIRLDRCFLSASALLLILFAKLKKARNCFLNY